MDLRKMLLGLALMGALFVVWWWALRQPFPDIQGTWQHVAGDKALGESCTIAGNAVTVAGESTSSRLERTEDGVVILRLLPDGLGLPLQRTGDQLLIMGPHGGEYVRQMP